MNLEGIFTSEPHSIRELFSENKTGYYIPPYQREYSWEFSAVFQIIKDACRGLELLTTQKDSVTFLGSVVFVHDQDYNTIQPRVHEDLPEKVLLIIDGQQRLTTLLLLVTTLHNILDVQHARLLRDNETAEWLANKTAEVLAHLKNCFFLDMSYGEDRLYPKMIRSYRDSWSRTSEKKYNSALARYLYKYIQEMKKDSRTIFDYDLKQVPDKQLKSHLKFEENRKKAIKALKFLAQGGNEKSLDYDLLSLFMSSKDMQSVLFRNPLESEVLNGLKNSKHNELAQLLIFSKYLLERVVLVEIKAIDESYAFDMFESLNTTGAALTAFETFKPQIIRNEGLENYKNSESRKYVLEIEEFLEAQNTQKKKIGATYKTIYSFALSETGDKVLTRLSEQRNELKKLESVSTNEQRIALRHLAYSSTYVQNVLSKDPKETEKRFFANPDLNLDTETQICLYLLRKLKTTAPVLIRFYSKYRECVYNNCLNVKKVDILQDFSKAIKAVTAFFILWHSSRVGSKSRGFDFIFQNLMKNGPFARRLKNTKPVSIKNLQLLLAEQLSNTKGKSNAKVSNTRGNLRSKEGWLNAFGEKPIYKTSKDVTRFILFLTTHKTAPIPGDLHLLANDKEAPLFLFEKWNKRFSIDHIAPQQLPVYGWAGDLYHSENIRDTIGNLTLLPPKTDSIVPSKSWEQKRDFYMLLSACSLDEQKQIRAKTNLRLSKTNYELLVKTKSLSHTDALSMIEDEWNTEWIKRRSRRLGEILWNRLMEWLPLPELLPDFKG